MADSCQTVATNRQYCDSCNGESSIATMSYNPGGSLPSSQGTARGNQDLPPPIPPRIGSPNPPYTGAPNQPRHSASLPMGMTLDGYQSGAAGGVGSQAGYQIHANRPQSISGVPRPPQTSQRSSQHLISLSPDSTRPPGGTVTKSASFSSDLEGLDFSMPSVPAPVSTTSTDADPLMGQGASKMYPDISNAFRELSNGPPRPQPPTQLSNWSHRPPPGPPPPGPVSGPHRNSMPIPYGWDQNLTQMAASGFSQQGSISVPTTPVQFSQPAAQNYSGYGQGTAQPQNLGVFPGFPTAGYGGGSRLGVTGSAGANVVAGNSPSSEACDNINLVPNLDFDAAWNETDAFSSERKIGDGQHHDSTDFITSPRLRKNSDLIELGFDAILTADEHEYFSLEYFDPLHKRARSVSVSSPHVNTNYFFAKPPDEESMISKDPNKWVTFDDGEVFGREDEGQVKEVGVQRGATQASVDTMDVEAGEDDAKSHEKLRKKLYIDEESDVFCQMVADLKNEYKSTDETTNLGFIVSPMCDKQQDAMSVKIVVYSSFATEPFGFTSDVLKPIMTKVGFAASMDTDQIASKSLTDQVQSLVEHVINHVLYSCLPSVLPSHMVQSLKSVEYILKVNDRSEYLLNDFPLSKYSYTHDCLKMDLDLCFCIMRRQDVALPFIRTTDDDIQQLYFPQAHVKDTDVTRESLEILMDTFYKEVEKVTDLVLQDQVGQVQFQALSQSVKAICNILSKIETLDISKCLQRVEYTLGKLKQSQHARSSTLEHSGGGYATLQRDDMKVSIIPELEDSLEALVNAVKRLVRIYCQAFHTDFHLGTRIEQPWDDYDDDEITCYYPQDVINYNESVIVQVCTVHRIPVEWGARFDEHKVECALYHGKKKLCPLVTTTCASVGTQGLVPQIVWDEWLTFQELSLCLLPRETRLCVTLYGLKCMQTGNANAPESQKECVALGGVTIQLFNRRGYMLQGSQLVPFQMNLAADPVTPFCSTLQSDSALLQFNLPDFGKQIMWSDPVRIPESRKKSFSELAPDVKEIIQEVMRKDCVSSCTADQLEILWTCRTYLHDKPRLLPWILQAAQSWDWACVPEIYALLGDWTTLQPMQSLELLLPQYPDQKVRSFAVDCLRKMPTDDLIDFIPQLIQALKYESYHSSPLARLLLEQSCKSVRFAHQFFWLLKGATQDNLYKRRYELMFVALVSVAGESLYQEFMKQEEMVKVLTQAGENVQRAKGGDKENVLRKHLEILYEKFQERQHVLLPHNPGYEVSGIDRNSCSFFTSNAVPLKLVFKNATLNAGSVYAMFKVGDDLRQDMMIMQIVRIMDRLWLKEGLDLKMVTFNCLPTGPKRGFIELITEAETLRKIQVSSGVTGSFKDRPIKDWLQKHNPTELDYQKAVENFTRSCAGYCVATYVLGVCDRHNDNIMLKQTGHLFHIDFNKILGDSQMFGNIKRDRVQFVLTSDMAYVINDGDRQSDKFQFFIDVCCQAFNILRKHANLFINLFSLMLRSGIPGITEKGVEFVQKALLPGLADTQASSDFTRMIQESLSSKSTQINFFLHNLAQMKFSSHSEGALLSFVPKAYNQQMDGRIKHVSVHGFQKRYSPEKHYIYTLKVERQNQNVPSYVFRIFSEFVEFRAKLTELFPQFIWPPLQGRVLGRSHIKAVAENRKAEIEKFVLELFNAESEVSHCDLVYTFFHPLLRDEQEARRDTLTRLDDRRGSVKTSPKISPTSPEGPVLQHAKKGQVKLSLEYQKDTIHIMVIHAKDLPSSGSELPSPYVKLYLLPDPEKQTKRKTKIIKDSTHPTYNEVIEYKVPRDRLSMKILQVTVWDHMLKGNTFLGAINIQLRDVDWDANAGPCWYTLGNIQLTHNSLS